MNQTYASTGTESLHSYSCIPVRCPQLPVHVPELLHKPPVSRSKSTNETQELGMFKESGPLNLIGSKLKQKQITSGKFWQQIMSVAEELLLT